MKTTDKNNIKTYKMVLSAIMIALSVLLGMVAPVKLPFGGSVTFFSQVPLIAISWIFGVKWGCFAGLALGILKMILGAGNFAYVNGFLAYLLLALLDYIIPYTFLGLGGIFKNKMRRRTFEIGIGSFWVCALRYACHFLSGIVLWNSNAPSQLISDVIRYSAEYNASYMIPETIITIIGAIIIEKLVLSKLDENGVYIHEKNRNKEKHK